jgi:uroporphyrinogen decarboxylase
MVLKKSGGSVMTSKERVRAAINHRQPDIVPADFACVPCVMDKLKKHYGFLENEMVFRKLDIDIRFVNPDYKGPELKVYYQDGNRVEESIFGYHMMHHWNGMDYNQIPYYYPLNLAETIEDIENYRWPDPDWFDYESVKRQCENYKDRAVIIGHAGVYQYATFMREASLLYMDMAAEPELAQRIFDKFVEFELEFYERIFIAADGQIDILRCYDDYGTQSSMLFSLEMWRRFFGENTRKLADLAHKYGAYYMQHSCGAIRPIIPELIDCGVDLLDPVQKVRGMEPEGLKNDFGSKLTFHGGIDTQWLLPGGTPGEVEKEARRFIEVLGKDGGYILYPSQEFQPDVPIENIEAMYRARF